VEHAGHPAPIGWEEERFSHPDQPIVAPSWFDATAYCKWLREMTGRKYRLPTEAEREKAARGGMEERKFPWGDDLPDWMNTVGRGQKHETPDHVGQDPPNGYDLH
ncbi:MAG: SUMF1/EgtB/PvdO family nonheme iron enzyme, partial [Planctomycetota bacterium]|nr:SUMF1/EgtB/PvdO family nonheme iron enzyme [Planctomycetota bacterium]